MFGRKEDIVEIEPAAAETAAPEEAVLSVVEAPADAAAAAADPAPAPVAEAPAQAPTTLAAPAPVKRPADSKARRNTKLQETIREQLLKRIDPATAVKMSRKRLLREIEGLVAEIANEERLQLNQRDQTAIATDLLDDMIGFGPIEPLLANPDVADILVNGPDQVYAEINGRLKLTDCQFRDNAHVFNVSQRIAAMVGRRIDESSPMVDARLEDGSRVNIIIPPLSLIGPCISIRKFTNKSKTLDSMAQAGTMSMDMAKVLAIASTARLNILISGGTGSGKTTMMNALSNMIASDERIVTIEDAAELQLMQPHVVSLETRPQNIEGQGLIDQRDLVKNALRMRPDRIIIGEVRGSECFDMLQAMNTGHDGSMSTLHANNPRDALVRLENMVLMGSGNMPARAIRTQIVSAIDLIIQVSRMRDGGRRIVQISEVLGMEGEVVTTQDLFTYEYEGENPDGSLRGSFVNHAIRPRFINRAAYYGLEKALVEAMTPGGSTK